MKTSSSVYTGRSLSWTRVSGIASQTMRIPKTNPLKVVCVSLLVLLLFLTLLINVWIHINIIHVGYQIAQLKHQVKMLKIDNRNLTIQKATLLTGKKLLPIARKKFHLVPLTPEQVITIDEKD